MPITLPLGLRRALCLLVRKARFRPASASLGRPSQPSAVSLPGLSHGPAPTTIPGKLRDPQFLPSTSLRLPMPSPPALPPPPNTEQRAPRHPAAKGFPLLHCHCLQVRCEDWGRRGEAANQLGNPDCILITNAKHPRAAICRNGKNQQVPGV